MWDGREDVPLVRRPVMDSLQLGLLLWARVLLLPARRAVLHGRRRERTRMRAWEPPRAELADGVDGEPLHHA